MVEVGVVDDAHSVLVYLKINHGLATSLAAAERVETEGGSPACSVDSVIDC